MGWSCRADAARTLERWEKACRESTGSSNTWVEDNAVFFYELDNVEHDDGAITGEIWRGTSPGRAVPAGKFRIEGDGTISSAPKFLRINLRGA